MKESEFQGWIVKTAETFGWRVWHVPTPMRPIGGNKFVPEQRGAGLADLILIHNDPPRLIFAEVKKRDGILSDSQKEFLGLARGVSHFALGLDDHRVIGVYVWRPGVEHMIEAILRGKVMVQ